MRSVFLLSVGLLFNGLLFSQNYTVKSLDLDLEGTPDEFEIVVKNEIYNLTSDTLFMKWVRSEFQVSSGWANAVCDNQQCYFPEIDSAEFLILPNDTSNFDSYFYPGGNEGFGSATMFLQQIEVSDTGVTIEYSASAQATGLDEFGSTILVEVQPNPFVETVYLSDLPAGEVIIELFDETGKLSVSSVTSLSNYTFNTQAVPTGSYVLIVRNKNGVFKHRMVKI